MFINGKSKSGDTVHTFTGKSNWGSLTTKSDYNKNRVGEKQIITKLSNTCIEQFNGIDKSKTVGIVDYPDIELLLVNLIMHLMV